MSQDKIFMKKCPLTKFCIDFTLKDVKNISGQIFPFKNFLNLEFDSKMHNLFRKNLAHIAAYTMESIRALVMLRDTLTSYLL